MMSRRSVPWQMIVEAAKMKSLRVEESASLCNLARTSYSFSPKNRADSANSGGGRAKQASRADFHS
jgi:hypothetical protein